MESATKIAAVDTSQGQSFPESARTLAAEHFHIRILVNPFLKQLSIPPSLQSTL